MPSYVTSQQTSPRGFREHRMPRLAWPDVRQTFRGDGVMPCFAGIGPACFHSLERPEKGGGVAEKQRRSGKGQPSAENQGTTAGQDELAQQLSEVSRSLQAQDNTDQMLDEVVLAAVALIPGVDEGSISVVTGRSAVTSQSPSVDLPRRVDAVQAELGEGPCLDAVFDQQTVQVPDMAHEQRWPRFAAAAAKAGAASMLSFQLYVEKDNLGALNLYSYRPNAFDDESEHVGLMFASHAAVPFADAQRIDQLNHKAAPVTSSARPMAF
jgi:transcriptional regulator with GAF, ATPase, and Fis domain